MLLNKLKSPQETLIGIQREDLAEAALLGNHSLYRYRYITRKKSTDEDVTKPFSQSSDPIKYQREDKEESEK